MEWAKPAVSTDAGEIVSNSIDADDRRAGFDLVITRRIIESAGLPVVTSGGAGSLEHLAEVLLEGKADAVLAASIFHFGTYTVTGCGSAVSGKVTAVLFPLALRVNDGQTATQLPNDGLK